MRRPRSGYRPMSKRRCRSITIVRVRIVRWISLRDSMARWPSQDVVSFSRGQSTKCMRTKDDINFVSDSGSFRSKLVLPPLSRGKSATNPVARQRRRRLEALQRLPRQRRRKSRLGSTERRPNQLDSRRGHRAARGCAPHEIQPDPLATLCKSNPRHALILRAGTRTLSSEHAQRTGTRQAIEPR